MMIEVKPEVAAAWPAAVVRRLDQGERILALIFRRKGEQGQTSYPMYLRGFSPGHYYLERPADIITIDESRDIHQPDVERAGGGK
jgi:hypothetical protein